MAAPMWAAKIRERWMARPVAWIVAATVVANFALLAIPSVSIAPLYQLTSEWCSLVLDKDPQVAWSASSIPAQLHSVVVIRLRSCFLSPE